MIGENSYHSVHTIATNDTSSPSVMTEQFNARSSDGDGRGTPMTMTGSQLLDAMMGQERMHDEAIEAQLEPIKVPESPACSIRTERSDGSNGSNERNKRNTTNIDASEDEIEMSQRQHRVDKQLHAITTVYGANNPPPLPSNTPSISRDKDLKEYLSQYRQLSKDERRKLLGEVKTILDVGDKSMISGMDRYGYGGRRMSDDLDNSSSNNYEEAEDDSLLASSEEGTYYSDLSTAFYTNDVSTAFCSTAESRTTMFSTSDDGNNNARGGGGRRRGGGRNVARASRGRKSERSRLYERYEDEEDDDEDEEGTLFGLVNSPCMSYLLCDFKQCEEAEVHLLEQTNFKDNVDDDDQESWDWNKDGKKKQRAEKVDAPEHQLAEHGGKSRERNNIRAMYNKSPSNSSKCGSLNSNGLTVKERMARVEEKLIGKKSYVGEEPVTENSLMEKLRSDAAEDSAVDINNPSGEVVKAGEHENNDRGIVTSDDISDDNAKDDIVAVAATDMESKLAINSHENELAGIELNEAVVAHKDNALPSTGTDKVDVDEVAVVKTKSIPRQRSESPFIKAMSTLSRKSSKVITAGEDANLLTSEPAQQNENTSTKPITRHRSASPFVRVLPTLPRKASKLNEVQPIVDSIIPVPVKESEQVEGACNKSSATEVSDDSAEMFMSEDAQGGKSRTMSERPPTPASSIASESKKEVPQLPMPPVEQQQELAESSVEMVKSSADIVHQKPPRAQRKRFKMSIFNKKKKTSDNTTCESPTNKSESEEPSWPASPEITVRTVESNDSPTIPMTPTKFEYQEKTDLADVVYVATRDSPVSTSTTSSATSRKKRRGWKEYTDLSTGEKYYSDGVTTTWNKPVNFSRDYSPVTTICDDTKSKANKGWREYVDRNTGKKYYSDGTNTTWEKPVDLEQ